MRASKAHSPQRKEHCISLLTHRQWVRRQRVNALTCCVWWPLPDLNRRPIDYESTVLTTELRGLGINLFP